MLCESTSQSIQEAAMQLLRSLLILANIILLTLLVSSSAAGLMVEKFDSTYDRLEFRHYRGGMTTHKSQRQTGASRDYVFGFFAEVTHRGQRWRSAIDLHVIAGKVKVADRYHRRVLASFANGQVRILPNWQACLTYGQPTFAAAGITIPPQPNIRRPRQFWAVKGRYYYRVKLFGTRWDCQRIAKDWGFETIIHADGGSSLNRACVGPSHALVFRERPKLVAKTTRQ